MGLHTSNNNKLRENPIRFYKSCRVKGPNRILGLEPWPKVLVVRE